MAAKLIIAALVVVAIGRRAFGNANRRPVKRVAVVGGGIAGAGAAYSLRKAGIEAVLFEKKPKIGGNAKAFTWNVEGHKVDTGLAVLAYPHEYFHSYMALLKELGMSEGALHELRYFVAEKNYRGPTPKPADGLECVFAHDEDFKPAEWLKQDLEKWKQLVTFVGKVNAFFSPSDYKSLYRMSIANPLNLIPLRQLCRMYGISDYFWERVFVPVHTSTFLEVEMDTIPAVMAELLGDMVPFDKIPEMRAWETTAYEVFARMLKLWPKDAVRTSCAVEKVEFIFAKDGTMDCVVYHEDTPDGQPGEVFDAVIFACSAPAAEAILKKTRPSVASVLSNPTEFFISQLEGFLLRNTMYTVDRDKTFETGVVHSDGSVFPEKYRKQLLEKHCNYMVVNGDKPSDVENHFIMSSWAPTANEPHVKGKKAMLVSYNCAEKTDKIEAEWTVTSRDAHPCLTITQMAFSIAVWPFLQGARNRQVYYCGSAFTPGNGHDLSLLSGFVVASELGAPYPFPNTANGIKDFHALRRMMLLFWA